MRIRIGKLIHPPVSANVGPTTPIHKHAHTYNTVHTIRMRKLEIKLIFAHSSAGTRSPGKDSKLCRMCGRRHFLVMVDKCGWRLPQLHAMCVWVCRRKRAASELKRRGSEWRLGEGNWLEWQSGKKWLFDVVRTLNVISHYTAVLLSDPTARTQFMIFILNTKSPTPGSSQRDVFTLVSHWSHIPNEYTFLCPHTHNMSVDDNFAYIRYCGQPISNRDINII